MNEVLRTQAADPLLAGRVAKGAAVLQLAVRQRDFVLLVSTKSAAAAAVRCYASRHEAACI